MYMLVSFEKCFAYEVCYGLVYKARSGARLNIFSFF